MQKFLITSTPILDGIKVLSYLGVVNTNIVIGTNFFADFAASFTDVFGGNSSTYQRKMDNMYESAKKELIAKAKNLGANAIVGFRIDFDEISGKGKSMFMLSVTGTACVVSSEQDNQEGIINIANVDSYELEKEVIKMKILEGLNGPYYLITEDDWNYILDNPSKDIAKLLVDKKYYQYTESNRIKIEKLISRLPYEESVSIVYPNFIQMREETYNDEYGTKTKREISNDYLHLIKNCKLFEPSYIIKLIPVNINKATSLLKCDKKTYTPSDLRIMEAVCDMLENLPDTGTRERGKTGMFSKEKEIWICANGHKNDIDKEHCQSCGINIKGVSYNDLKIFDSFKKKTIALKNLMSQSTL